MDVPAIAAASAVSDKYRVSSLPCLMPAAHAPAAVVAASSIPNDVPFTDASADDIILSTLLASCPKPKSLARASSMPAKRLNPLTRVIPARAVVAAIAGFEICLLILCPKLVTPLPSEPIRLVIPEVFASKSATAALAT